MEEGKEEGRMTLSKAVKRIDELDRKVSILTEALMLFDGNGFTKFNVLSKLSEI